MEFDIKSMHSKYKEMYKSHVLPVFYTVENGNYKI
jgi:hypothetical protein